MRIQSWITRFFETIATTAIIIGGIILVCTITILPYLILIILAMLAYIAIF